MTNRYTTTDEEYMRRCLQLAACGRANARPNPMVGAVIVVEEDGDSGDPPRRRIIGEGYHVRCGEGHAEVNAFASVRKEDERLLPVATLYVSLEPCAHYGRTPPCADLIVSKGVRRVVVGCVDSFAKVQGRGIQRLREAGIEVTVGVLEEECRWLNRRFFTFHGCSRPYIILKYARTKDGFIDQRGRPLHISTPYTQMLMHRLRAEEDAIVVGRITACREHPQLNVRHWSGPSPVGFVLSASRNDQKIGMKSVLGTRSDDDKSVEKGHIWVRSVEELMDECRRRQLQSLIVEGGRHTLQHFIDHDLWDEMRIETAPWDAHEGTPAPTMPAQARLLSSTLADGNRIDIYERSRE